MSKGRQPLIPSELAKKAAQVGVTKRLMPLPLPTPSLETFRYWARIQFSTYSKCVGFIDTEDDQGNRGIGTCFHVGEGVFVTARHVVEGRRILEVGFHDLSVTMELIQDFSRRDLGRPGALQILEGPVFHPDARVDVACLRMDYVPKDFIPLGGHFDDYLGQYDLLLHRALVLGYPSVPMTSEPVLVASLGEINALVTLRDRKHVHFLVSSMARGGFSGGPVLVAYDELNEKSGTALLGLVTDSLVRDDGQLETGFMTVLSIEPVYDCLESNAMLPAVQRASEESAV